MAYEDLTALRGKVDRLREPFKGGLIQILRNRKADKLDEQLQTSEERNRLNRARELAQLLQGAETGMTGGAGMGMGALKQKPLNQFLPTDPEVQALAAKLRLDRVGTANQPSNVREWEYFSKLPQSQQEQYLTMRRGTSPINLGDQFVIPSAVNPAGAPRASFDVGIRPQDQPELRGDQRAAVEEAITAAIPQRVATQTAADRQAQLPQAQARLASEQRQATLVENFIDQAEQLASGWTTGVGGALLSDVPNTPAHDLSAVIDSIEANIGFDKLNQMRQQSPTGGALGAVTERELALLSATLGSLKQSQSPDQFKQNLETLREQVRQIVHGSEQQFQQTYGGSVIQDADAILRQAGLIP